jgi:hypothetical protein
LVSTAPAAITQLSAALATVNALDVPELSDSALVCGLEELLTIEAQLHAVQARWLGAADTRDATVGECGRSTRWWLMEECNLGRADAGARMRLAQQLPAFPAVEDALAAGEVTAAQAGVMVSGLLSCPVDVRDAVEKELVTLAATFPPFHLSQAVETILGRLGAGQDDSERAARRFGRRSVELDQTFAGTGSLSGTLTPETYEALRLAIAAACGSAPSGAEDDRTAAQRRHDALGAVARHYLAHADLPAVAGERPRVVVTMDRATLVSASVEAVATERWAKLDGGLPLPPETARRLACDAQLLPVAFDRDTGAVELGRTTRVWSQAIRRAAWLRDGGRCAFPKCRRPPADLHHVVWWSQGGRTDLDNGAWLCSFHHWLIHEGGWSLRRDADRGYVFTAADGREFGPPPRHTQPA